MVGKGALLTNTLITLGVSARTVQKSGKQGSQVKKSKVSDSVKVPVKKDSGIATINEMIEPNYVPRDANGKEFGLPRYDNGKIVSGTSHIPESQFPHSQIGIKGGRSGKYIQTLEWGYDGKPIQRTDHGRGDHVNPHSHLAILKDGSWSLKK